MNDFYPLKNEKSNFTIACNKCGCKNTKIKVIDKRTIEIICLGCGEKETNKLEDDVNE